MFFILRRAFIIALLWIIVIMSYPFLVSAETPKKPNNIILIGWDGTQREHLMELLTSGKLQNLQKLISEGSLVNTQVITGSTETKPGWAEILTGYSSDRMEIYDNDHYKPIPKGYTIFERLESYFGAGNIVTIFIGGKTSNIGSRGPHEICENAYHRDPLTRQQTFYWDKRFYKAGTVDGKPERWVFREGEPYFNSKKFTDLHITGLGSAEKVAKRSLAALNRYHRKPFFAFFHFQEPDEQGHVYGENSYEYTKALETADYWLGVIVKRIKDLGIYDKTIIYVTSDHGMNENAFNHKYAPYMFLATNSKRALRDGDRKDITPTIYEEYGIDCAGIKPELDGKSLLKERAN